MENIFSYCSNVSYYFVSKGMFQTPIQKFDFVVSIITWIGLFGFVFDIQILTSIVWKCIFLFSVIWTLTAVFVFRLYEERDEPLPFIFKVIGIIPTLPLYYGLYQYAFKKTTMDYPIIVFLLCFLHKSSQQMLIKMLSR